MSDPGQRSSRVLREQSFSGARAESARADKEQEHRHEEARKDNAQRRLITNAVSAFLAAATVAAFVIAIGADNDGTRGWGQGLVTLLIGGFVGFVTGRAAK